MRWAPGYDRVFLLKGKIMVCLMLMNDPAETVELLTQETEETIAVAVP